MPKVETVKVTEDEARWHLSHETWEMWSATCPLCNPETVEAYKSMTAQGKLHIDEDQHEYPDNYRVALLSDAKALKAYEVAAESGCCGTVDLVLYNDDGQMFVFGFNYGH